VVWADPVRRAVVQASITADRVLGHDQLQRRGMALDHPLAGQGDGCRHGHEQPRLVDGGDRRVRVAGQQPVQQHVKRGRLEAARVGHRHEVSAGCAADLRPTDPSRGDMAGPAQM
jgi:hypothetical protein